MSKSWINMESLQIMMREYQYLWQETKLTHYKDAAERVSKIVDKMSMWVRVSDKDYEWLEEIRLKGVSVE